MENLNTSSDASATSWLSDLLLEEIEDCNLFQQCDQNLVGDEEFLSDDIMSALQEGIFDPPLLSSESYTCYPVSNSETRINSSIDETNSDRPTKKMKTTKSTSNLQDISPSSSPPSHTSQNLSFENLNPLSPATHFHGFDCTLNTKQKEDVPVPLSRPQHRNMTQNCKGSTKNQNCEIETKNPQGHGTKRSLANAQDHIIAERKRREKLSQSLIALAALIPGLKKMDKASVLGDAIKYVKELQERLKVLEEQNKNKPQISCNDNSTSCDNGSEAATSSSSGNSEALPHVEARVSDKDVLLRVHCQKQKGLLVKILVEIQSLHLSIVNSSVLPFGDSILDITIVAQMGRDYNLTRNDLVENIRVAALRSMS